ncbi:type VII secretion EsaA-like protein [Metabacillus crassostreae]|uniref:type VII secretion protein EsaA n=1 Tax=Metabacillus crassostreae TaxID=929098 RepID=UPI00195CB20A|nr:type VII secretion protein EsaA [Metabacillus crassostreae]MBM7605172.1 type VII secretion EsaA-like protein [Metabacillus crassostreae]
MKKSATIIKLLVVIALIVITPLLFFRIIGDNPFKVEKVSAAQTIAIINEDIGTEEEGEQIQFGQDIASILKENSSFEWTVVGRSAGENGLKSQKYDAIVYLPSNFSENVMSYNEANPVKTNFQYKVQSQLNAVNKEKVLLELEKSTKKVNQKISTLYWNYVSADMENIRQEFDEILEKEVAFQEAMSAFYQPSSKDLAGQIEEQKAMLSSIQSSIQDAGKRTPDQQSMLEDYEQNLTSFVEYVEQYKEYQDKQQQILAEIQKEAIQSVTDATTNQQPLFLQSKDLFEEKGGSFIETMKVIDSQMVGSQQVFGQLEEQRYSQVARQISDYYNLQKKLLDFYQQLKDTTELNAVEVELASYSDSLNEMPEEPEEETPDKPEEPGKPDDENPEEEKPDESDSSNSTLLTASTEPNEDPLPSDGEDEDNTEQPPTEEEGEPEVPTEPTEPTEPETPEEKFVDLSAEKAEIMSIADEMTDLKETLSALLEPTPDDLEGAIVELEGLSERLADVNISLSNKENGENPLQSKLDDLQNTLAETIRTASERIKNLEGDIGVLEADKKELEEERDNLIGDILDLEKSKEDLQKLYDDLLANFNKLEAELNLYKDYETSIKDEITNKEQSILSSKALSETRKEKLTKIFSKEINSKDLLDMMFYYSYLDRYEATLISMISEDQAKKDTLSKPELQDEANKIVAITNEEQVIWDQLKGELPTTQDALNTMEDNFTVFMVEYQVTVDEHQTKLIESLDMIAKEAQEVLNQIQQPEKMLSAAPPTSTIEGQEMIVGTERINDQMESIHTWLDSVQESQTSIIDYTGELQGRVGDVQADADKLNNKWATNVASTELIRNDVFSVLGNTFVDGQSNGYVYDFLTNPLKISGDIPEETKSTVVKNIPPVVVLFIVLVCSLLIGYTSYYFKQPPLWIQGILFLLLNLIVGFVVSLFGLDIYPLREESAVEWTIFTIVLLTVGSALVRVGFAVHHLVGLFITVGMVIFYVTPLLALTTPNFSFQDPMSKVYMSIQYGTESLFTQAMIVLCLLLLGLGALQYFIGRSQMTVIEKGSETYEA